MLASGYPLKAVNEYTPRPVTVGEAACVEGGKLLAAHMPCEWCSADPPRPCPLVTLCDQVDHRTLLWAQDPPAVAPVSAPIPWDAPALAAGAQIVKEKYLPGGVLVPVAEPAASAPLAAPAADRVLPGAGQLVSGGSALASFVNFATTLVVPADTQADQAELVRWLTSKAEAAVQRIRNELGAGRRHRAAHINWTRYQAAVLDPRSADVKAKPRLITDARAVNEHQRAWKFRLLTLNEILAAVRPGYWAAVRDFKGGYTHIRLAEATYKYAQTHLPEVGEDGKMYMRRFEHHRQFFGDSSAVALFSALSAFLLALCRRRGVPACARLFAYIDDITIVASTKAACRAALDVFEAVCAEVGVAIEHSKDQGPSQLFTVLGVTVDTRAGTLSLPPEKQARRLLELLVARGCAAEGIHVPARALVSLLGKLEHWCSVIVAGRTQLTHLWRGLASRGGQRGASGHGVHGHVALHGDGAAGARSELDWWVEQLRRGSLAPQRLLGDATSTGLQFAAMTASDAAGDNGWGITLGPTALWGTWMGEEARGSSSLKELVPVGRLLERYAPLLVAQVLLVTSDNEANVSILNKGRTAGDADGVMKRLMDVAAAWGVTIVAVWVPREANVFADSFSRCRTLSDALSLCRVPVVGTAPRGLGVPDLPADGLRYGRRGLSILSTHQDQHQ
jgi:hypothetical protein